MRRISFPISGGKIVEAYYTPEEEAFMRQLADMGKGREAQMIHELKATFDMTYLGPKEEKPESAPVYAPEGVAGVGTRGGPTEPLTLEGAQTLFEEWKSHEYGWVRRAILQRARRYGEFHGEMLSHEELSERNIIGAAVNALLRQGLIYNTGRHRPSRSPAAHGRKSYVYRLTDDGKLAAGLIDHEPGENLTLL